RLWAVLWHLEVLRSWLYGGASLVAVELMFGQGVWMNRTRTVSLIALVLISWNQVCAQSAQPGAGKSFKGPLAVQLWSFRNDFMNDVPGTLKRVHDLGFREVELAGYYGLTAKQFRAELDKAGLKAISMHIEYEFARDRIDEVIQD